MQDRCGGSVVGGQVDVPGREGQPVGLPDGRAAHHLGHAQVAGHPLDHPELLAVLLAEVGAVGPNDPEQHRDDGRDAGEVPRSRGALQRERQPLDGHRRVEPGRVDVVDRGEPDEVRAGIRAQPQVGGLAAGVPRKVGRIVELAGIDEDRDRDGPAFVAGSRDQGAVAGMEPAHRGDQPQRSVASIKRAAELGAAADDVHRRRIRGRDRAGSRHRCPAGRRSSGRPDCCPGPRRGPHRPSG